MSQTNNTQSNCTLDWSKPFVGSDWYKVPFFPDGNATYWYVAITRFCPDDPTGLMLTGQFGHARYQSITVYDDETGNPIGSLRDNETTPDQDNNNPYLLAINRDTPDRDYSIAIVPEGSYTDNYTNVITFPKDLLYLSIYLRVYLPDEDVTSDPETGYSGGVPLPTITAFDTRTGAPTACPETRGIPMVADSSSGQGNDSSGMPAPVDGQIRFYNLSASGFYGTDDNHYLSAPFDPVKGTVAVLRFKPPTHTDTSDPDGVLDSETEVRYWSFIVCSEKLTITSACLADYQAVVDDDGFVNLMLGPPRLEKKAKARGFNFLPWGRYEDTVVIYRNLVSNQYFPYSNGAVPLYNSDAPQEGQSAENFIGDYAPVGVQCSIEEFLANYNGVSAPSHRSNQPLETIKDLS